MNEFHHCFNKDAFIIQKKVDHFLDGGVPTSRVGFVFYHFFRG